MMDSTNSDPDLFKFSEENVQKLKERYSTELRDDVNNPIKVCMKLIFDAAIEKDPSKRSSLSVDLSKFLTKSDGIINLFLALVDFDVSSQKVTTHNQRFLAVANIITCLPKLSIAYENYCDNITRQLKPLLIQDDPIYVNLASIIIKSMIESPHARNRAIESIVLKPYTSALFESDTDTKPHEAIIAIHNLLQNSVHAKQFVAVFPNLFYALTTLYKSPSRLKGFLERCITMILNDLDPGVACCLFEKTLFYSQEINKIYSVCEDQDEITIKMANEDERVEPSEEILLMLVHSLLEGLNNDLIILEFYFHFQAIIRTGPKSDFRRLSLALIEPFLSQTVSEESTKLDLLRVTADNTKHALNLISRTLVSYVDILEEYQTNQDSKPVLEFKSMTFCIESLEVLSLVTQNQEELSFIEIECLPVLRQLDSAIKKISPEANTEISDVAHGVSSLIERLERNMKTSDSDCSSDGASRRKLDEALKNLNDPLVPVRAHTLVELKQIVMTNDSYISSQIPKLFDLVSSSLADQEPYIFLTCINLISEMAIRQTAQILPKLIELHSSQDLSIQQRINVGESLVRLFKRTNSMTPVYAQQVMNALVLSCEDPEHLIRMSSLVNIGEICYSLGDSLGKYIIDVLHCVQLGISDDLIEVRCAAIDLLRSTLSGLNKFKAESIQGDLKTIYKLLKRLRARTIDEKLCLQVDLALDEMGRLARELLGSGHADGSLVKNIRVLSNLR